MDGVCASSVEWKSVQKKKVVQGEGEQACAVQLRSCVCNCFAIISLPGGDTDRWVIVEDGDELEKKADDDEEQDEVEVLGEAVEGFATVADSFAAAVVLVVESIGLSEVFAEIEDKVNEGVVVPTMELFLSFLLLVLLLMEGVK